MKKNNFLIGVHAVILNEKRELLVIQRSETNDFMPLKWDLPGGTVNFEEEVKKALVREIGEELSVDAEVGNPIDVYDCFENGVHCVQILFSCNLLKNCEISLNNDEHAQYMWTDFSKLKCLDKIGFLANLCEKGLLENIIKK